MRYAIYAPEYSHNSAGIRVLYRLAYELRKRGHEAIIVPFDERIKEKDVCAVYPEIVEGNPLKSEKVARYVLYYPGKIAGDEVYDNNELVFYYSDLYKDSIQNETKGKLFIPVVELDIFYDRELERDLTTCWFGKGEKPEEIPEEYTIITSSYPETREGVANIFSRSKYFVCYDPATLLVQEAILCGCPVVLMAGYENYHKNEFGLNGVCSCVEDLDKAKETMHRVASKFYRLEHELNEQINNFIEVTSG